MHRISPNNPVRRRLFDEEPEEAVRENFANVLQEQALRVKEDNVKKWNFDFENERPLEGAYEWTECSEGNIAYVGKARLQGDSLEATEEDDLEIAAENNTKARAEDNIEVDGDDTDEEYESVNLIQKKNETTPGKKKINEKEDAPLLKREIEKTDRKSLQYE